ncbi:TPA: tetratricopeptide repeat protein, partial [Flavobacterium psychrophilum]
MKKIILLAFIITQNLFCQITSETEKTLSYKEETAELITKLNKDALTNKRPQIGNFDVSVSFFEKVISKKLNINDFYRHIYKYIEYYKDQKFYEYNELTGEHDLLVVEPEIIINFKGSKIVVKVKSYESEESPITYINASLMCRCEWFNVKNQAKLSGYTQTEYSDNTDKRSDYFGGLEIKYKKLGYELYYEKFASKLYSEFSISQIKPKNKKPVTSNEFLTFAKIRYKEGKSIEAMENTNKAIALDKNNSEAYFFKGTIYFNAIEGNKEFVEGSQTWETMQFFNKAIELNNKNEKIFLKRASLFEIINENDKAILDYKKVIEINPTIENQIELIDYLIRKKEIKLAHDEVVNLLIKEPTNSELIGRNAILFFYNGENCKARDELERAKKN